MADLILSKSTPALRKMPAASFDSCVTDPPYGLKFMGRRWDYDVPSVAHWKQVLRVLKPGAVLAAFGGPRTSHRLACRIEDAGFELFDSIAWLYGTGKPKARTLLKPAHEPIILARVPGEHAGGIQVEACRLPYADPADQDGAKPQGRSTNVAPGLFRPSAGEKLERVDIEFEQRGRWPANVILTCACEVEHEDEDCPVRLLDEQSGILTSGDRTGKRNAPKHKNSFNPWVGGQESPSKGDSGGASRFFYCAKASPSERGHFNTHPTVKPLALMRHLVRLVTPPGGRVLDCFMGSGTTPLACQFEGMACVGIDEDPKSIEIAQRRLTQEAFVFGEAAHG